MAVSSPHRANGSALHGSRMDGFSDSTLLLSGVISEAGDVVVSRGGSRGILRPERPRARQSQREGRGRRSVVSGECVCVGRGRFSLWRWRLPPSPSSHGFHHILPAPPIGCHSRSRPSFALAPKGNQVLGRLLRSRTRWRPLHTSRLQWHPFWRPRFFGMFA